ncbi:maleylacetoacetate isomerase [Sphingopyxis sp. RIFCSPHIGHO2_12_FULL_65_19]|uniref:maleylacetoacetate isomerase n=1 Tax=Sphingopyxis sp. RIFCSPHIGHO2_12_FULL_65_19 TaxID=1802172 RepID=UPI0008BBFC05|nr:maleylacetoacetate isomerase [Sphingopyxis sp. RIFCSPHIGHO2_12_FULL_65_19]OHD06186.1 MAG: maleylacetoacetate isomerase [Sphingopyxis sp. RIFCSPHIGHO2_12_FULL_65_19]
MTDILLHGFWRSSAAYRVRIALGLKGLAYRQQPLDLLAGEQHGDAYAAIAPHHLVPALEHDGRVLIESPAILEWIDAKWPTPPLLPGDIDDAAAVRGMAALIACDIHPLNNLRVLNAIRGDFAATNPQVKAWIARWITDGFAALETLVGRHGGNFAFGDTPTLADCYLVPQIDSAERYSVDLAPFPRLCAAADAARALPAVAAARPELQEGAPPLRR